MKKLKLFLAGAGLACAFNSHAQIPLDGIPIDINNLPQWMIDMIRNGGGTGGNNGGKGTVDVPLWDDSYAKACTPLAPGWVVGGNEINPPSGAYVWVLGQEPPEQLSFNIGTCNKYPFILKSENKETVFITPSARVGIGLNNSNPLSVLDVVNSDPANASHLRFFGDQAGNIVSETNFNLIATGDFNFAVGGLNASNSAFHVDGSTGNAGINTLAGSAKLTVDASGASASEGITLKVGSSTPNAFDVYNTVTGTSEFRVKSDGKIFAREVTVQLTPFPDYVFKKDYKLLPIEQLDSYIKSNKHLPNVPTEEEIKKKGADLGELSRIQIEKIEELTLYIIELKKEINELKKEVYK